jgi:predicted AAA+ superfamily ATPase
VEVDFYIPEKSLAIQVCYNLNDDDTRKREVNALLKINKQFGDLKLMIITKDDFDTISIDNMEIEVVPVWRWLLG